MACTRQSGKVAGPACLAKRTTLPIIKAAPPLAYTGDATIAPAPALPRSLAPRPAAETVDVARILKRKVAFDPCEAIHVGERITMHFLSTQIATQNYVPFIFSWTCYFSENQSFGRLLQGTLGDTMTTSDVGCKRRSLSPLRHFPAPSPFLPS